MGVLLAYDCTNEASFNDINSWMKQVDNHAHSQIVKAVVATKADRVDRVISSLQGQALAELYGSKFFETSAKLGLGVKDVFSYLVREVVKRQLHLESTSGPGPGPGAAADTQHLVPNAKPKKKKCC